MRGDNFIDSPQYDWWAVGVAVALLALPLAWPLLVATASVAFRYAVRLFVWADGVIVWRPRPRSRLPREVRRGLAAVPNAAERAALAVAVARSYRRRAPRPPERLTGLAAAFMRWAV